MPQDTKPDQETDKITNEPKRLNGDHSLSKVTPVVVPVRLRWILVSTGIFLVALLIVSVFYPFLSERIKFFTVNALSICVLAAIVIQAYIYRRQWEVMERQFAAFENQTAQSEWQFRQTQQNAADIQEQMRDQSQAMKGQLAAMQRQAEFIEAQAKIMADSLTETRKIVEHNERTLKASQEHSDRQVSVMELQAGIAEIQTGLADQQVNAMREQLEAMRGQLDAMKEQATIMRDTLAQSQKQIEMSETVERGYMGIGDMTLSNLVVGGRPTVTIKWVNGGRTPVWNFRAMPFIVFGEKPISNKFHFIDDDTSPIRGSFFPVGAEREVKYEVPDVINAEDWARFERGKIQLFILGNFVYRDINGTRQIEAISAMYDRFERHVYETYQYVDAEQTYKFAKPT